MNEEVKRGPGRPPKVHAEPERSPERSGPPQMQRVKVLRYKIQTSQGRYIEGQFASLPADEAAKLDAIGHVALC